MRLEVGYYLKYRPGQFDIQGETSRDLATPRLLTAVPPVMTCNTWNLAAFTAGICNLSPTTTPKTPRMDDNRPVENVHFRVLICDRIELVLYSDDSALRER